MARCTDCQERDASSTKTLCQRCYKRRLGGRPPLITLRRAGDPDGHGQYGILDVDEESVLCHECGRRLRGLGTHLLKAHGMTAAEYRDAHGLPRGMSLTCLETQRTVSEQARARIGTPGWEAFEAACDPVAAAHARGTWTLAPALVAARTGVPGPSRPRIIRTCRYCGVEYTGKRRTCGAEACRQAARLAGAKRRAPRPMTDAERAELLASDGAGRTGLVQALQAGRVSSREIGAVLGHGPAWMSAHYPVGRSPVRVIEPRGRVEVKICRYCGGEYTGRRRTCGAQACLKAAQMRGQATRGRQRR